MSDKINIDAITADEVVARLKSKVKWATGNEVEVVVKPPKVWLKLLLSALIAAGFAAGYYYINFPALNLKSTDFYRFVLLTIGAFAGAFYLLIGARTKIERKEYFKRKSVIPIALVAVILIFMGIGWLTGATIFRAKAYSRLMEVDASSFSEDFSKINYDEVPRLDAATAKVLADQQLGYLHEFKSQYVVTNDSTQINYKGAPVRVAYLEYANVFKWFNNTKKGLPAYMLIDLVSQKVQVVNCVEKFGEGIKYSPTELFNEKLQRHIQFCYPNAILGAPNFEVNDVGRPYWITPVLDKTIGLFGGTDVKGAIITNALDGKCKYYSMETLCTDKTLSWIDVVYSENLILEQYNFYGRLSNGFWNSLIFQNGVNVASGGNGNIALDDDVWVYTGVTSIESDSSNFGFILCNQRTKETRYYENDGATEISAMESAQDAVQNYSYRATFPILLEIEGQPTYFMSFYGEGYTIKGYALVNLKDKTIVGRGVYDEEKSDINALNAAVENYINAMKDKNVVDKNASAEEYKAEEQTETPVAEETAKPREEAESQTVTGKITDIKTAVLDGNTVYYLQVESKYYYIKAVDCMEVLLVNEGDTVEITYTDDAENFIPATAVTKK